MLPLLLIALALQAPGPVAPPAPPAPPPPVLNRAPAPQDPLRGEWPAKPSGKRITLTTTLTVDQALDHISDAAGWNAVLSTGRTGARTITLKLRDVPVEDALRAALSGTGLVATRTGGTVVVAEGAEVEAPVPVLAGFDPPTGKRFTGDFDEEAVSDALKEIAAAAEVSIVLPSGEVHGTVTASFKSVPVEDALRAVLAQGHLTARREGSLLVVQRSEADLGGLLPGLGREARRTAEQAVRDAQEAIRRAQDREPGKAGEVRDAERKRDRNVTGADLTIAGGEDVRDVNVVRGNLLLQGGASARNATAVLGSVKLDSGAEARDVVAVLGSVTLGGGASAREVVAIFGDVNIGPGAEVEQDVISIGGRVHVDPSAEVGGSTQAVTLPQLPHEIGVSIGDVFGGIVSPWVALFKVLARFTIVFLLGFLVQSALPRRLEVVSNVMASSPVSSVVAGLLGLLGALLLGVLLSVTLIGIPLALVLLLAVLGGAVVGLTALTQRLGELIPLPAPRRTQALQLAAGCLVFSVLAQVPVLGFLIWVATVLLGIGAVVRTRFGQPPAMVLPTTPAPPVGV